jgi:hypothetical protein
MEPSPLPTQMDWMQTSRSIHPSRGFLKALVIFSKSFFIFALKNYHERLYHGLITYLWGPLPVSFVGAGEAPVV